MRRSAFVVIALFGHALVACGTGAVRGLSDYSGPHKDFRAASVTASAYVPRLDLLALGYRDGTFEVRSPAPRHLLSTGQQGTSIVALALSPDGARLASVDSSGTLLVSHVADGSYSRLEVDTSGAPRGGRGPRVGLGWDRAGRRLAVAAGTTLQLVDLEGDVMCEATLTEPASGVAFSPRDDELVIAGTQLAFFGVPQLELRRHVPLPPLADARSDATIRDVRFAPDAKLLGVVVPGGIGFLNLEDGQWDTGRLTRVDPSGLRFDETGRVVVFGTSSLYVGPPRAADIESQARSTQGALAAVEVRQDGSLLLLGDVADAEIAALLP